MPFLFFTADINCALCFSCLHRPIVKNFSLLAAIFAAAAA